MNTPAVHSARIVYEGFTPELFKAYVEKAIDRVQDHPKSQRIVFLKAWNEWAEGNIVEPDAIFGHALMNSLREAVFPAR